MPITSTFYDTLPGEGVNELEWAVSSVSRGPDYGVVGTGDLMLTAHPSTPYAVVLSTGSFFGHGVSDASDEPVNVQCDSVATGSTRWDLICVHRDWTPTGGGPTVFAKVNGTATQAIPAVRANTPGEVDDQPLWLVQWTGGQTQPTAIIDLRCWAGNGGMVAADQLALDYLARPGACVLIDSITYRYALGANSVWGWSSDAVSTYGFVQPSGWSLAGECRVQQVGARKRVDMDVNIARSGANFTMPVNDFSSLGAVLSNSARGDSGPVKYLPIAVSGGGLGNNKTAQAYVNTKTGAIGFRSNEGTWPWVKGAQTTINLTYYI